ncbi:hypothetical protein [Azomonas macrocytogenes]|uniref:Uncharacterized protein n=1 Tax=Azomonas macrocytogenes TaxID=69962 RepID=A0A839T630_AZOMA|nr:hypothetical protein [Azomonas macrocytogenes]MBB3104872.1 hypothetical protein [Azomonas macrocytogenes]
MNQEPNDHLAANSGETLQQLVQMYEKLQSCVLEMEIQHRVDQDFICILMLLFKRPEKLQDLWKMSASAIAEDISVRWAHLDGQDDAGQIAQVKEVMNDRFDFWSERIQFAIDIRKNSGSTN